MTISIFKPLFLYLVIASAGTITFSVCYYMLGTQIATHMATQTPIYTKLDSENVYGTSTLRKILPTSSDSIKGQAVNKSFSDTKTTASLIEDKVPRLNNLSVTLPSAAFPCLDPNATQNGRVEDLFCRRVGPLIPEIKNPCFYDVLKEGVKKLRCLPYYYILGMDKCASTDLYNRMTQHPQIMTNNGAIHKEAIFWAWRRYFKAHMTIDGYTNVFSQTTDLLKRDPTKQIITGDASPMDLYDFKGWRQIPQNKGRQEPIVLTPHLIQHVYGTHIPKMILLFREPVSRLFSLYAFQGHNPDDFHKDAVLSLKTFKKCLQSKRGTHCYFDRIPNMPVSINTGCYSVFIREWFAVFPRKNFLVTFMNETSQDMTKALKNIFSYLEVDPLPLSKLEDIRRMSRKHVTKRKVGKTVPVESQKLLEDFYTPYNQEAARIMQDDRFLWKRS